MQERRPSTILAVADDQAFLDRLARLLEGKGFRSVCRRAASDAAALADGPIAGGILEVLFPDGPDGLRLCEELRRRRPDAALILASTVFGHPNWRTRAAELGADCFFDRSQPLETLVADLRYAVEGLRPTLVTGRVIPSDARKVVVADDDAEWRKMACLALETQGYLPYEAENGRRALLAVGRLRPAAAIIDFKMPDLSGKECLEYLRRSPRTNMVPVLIATDQPDPAIEDACWAAGANDFALKSRSVTSLLRRILRVQRPAERILPRSQAGPFWLAVKSRILYADGKGLPVLSPAEFALMSLLIDRSGEVVAWDEVERRLHGAAASGSVESPSTKMVRLRLCRKLGRKYRACVVTWRKAGLQLDVLKVRK